MATIDTAKLSSSEKNFADSIVRQGIIDPVEISQFLAQIREESGFQPIEETLFYNDNFLLAAPYSSKTFKDNFQATQGPFPSDKVDTALRAFAEKVCCGKNRETLANYMYGNVNGNGGPNTGDGYKYRGRGYIQLTGKNLYEEYGKALNIDLVNKPESALNPDIATRIAIRYWNTRVKPKIRDFTNTTEVTRIVNGKGLVRLPERQKYFVEYYQKLVNPLATESSLNQQAASGNGYFSTTYQPAYTDVTSYQNILLPKLINKDLEDPYFFLDDTKLRGENFLITQLASGKAAADQQVNTVLNQLQGFTPDAAKDLVTKKLFALNPSEMRNKMFSNIKIYDQTTGRQSAHAWRAPGKLAITATLTIPGMSGFRIAQIFWIDRISAQYKAYGAFQLFGLTEHIDISRGWTTELYSRYNVIPINDMRNLVDYNP